MKALSVINMVLCLILVAGVCFLAVRTEQTVAKIDQLSTTQEEKTRELSDEISRAWTRIGEVETTSGGLAQRMESLSSKGVAAADLESEIKKILNEERGRRMRQWQQQAERWRQGELKPGQREAVAEMAGKAAKDYLELQAKIRAGEVPREEEGKIIQEWLRENLPKFRQNLDAKQVPKTEE